MNSQLLKTAVMLAFWLLVLTIPGSVSGQGDDYSLVLNRQGYPLGVIYQRDGTELYGELGRMHDTGLLIFVACTSRNIYLDEEYMRRWERNCQSGSVHWPDDLLSHMQAAGHRPVRLTGPPRTCGICVPNPFDDLRLPPGVEIIPPDLRQLLKDTLPPLELPATMAPVPDTLDITDPGISWWDRPFDPFRQRRIPRNTGGGGA